MKEEWYGEIEKYERVVDTNEWIEGWEESCEEIVKVNK